MWTRVHVSSQKWRRLQRRLGCRWQLLRPEVQTIMHGRWWQHEASHGWVGAGPGATLTGRRTIRHGWVHTHISKVVILIHPQVFNIFTFFFFYLLSLIRNIYKDNRISLFSITERVGTPVLGMPKAWIKVGGPTSAARGLTQRSPLSFYNKVQIIRLGLLGLRSSVDGQKSSIKHRLWRNLKAYK